MICVFKYSDSNKRYYTLDYYYKHKFGSKVCKVSLDGGFTCPNKDGSVGTGGCIYCSKSGSAEYAGDKRKPLVEQFNDVKKVMDKKWPNAKLDGGAMLENMLIEATNQGLGSCWIHRGKEDKRS